MAGKNLIKIRQAIISVGCPTKGKLSSSSDNVHNSDNNNNDSKVITVIIAIMIMIIKVSMTLVIEVMTELCSTH